MEKIEIDRRFSPYTMPTVIVGAIADEKPNYMLCTWASRVNRAPPLWIVSINNKHRTLVGIKEQQKFSMNFPSIEILELTDYIGLNSGRDMDKSELFEVFYGETGAPLIRECALNIELIVKDMVILEDHHLIIGNAVKSYISKQYSTEKNPDLNKMNLFVYTGFPNQQHYWKLGAKVGVAFSSGKNYKV